MIGGHADKGVIAGGGSSTVFPEGVTAVPGLEPRKWPGPVVFDPSPPLAAIQARAGPAQVTWVDGSDVAAAATAAKAADLVIVFATQWTAESQDAALSLDGRPGRPDRGGDGRQSEERGGARDRRAGADAVARQGGRRARGLVSRIERRRSDRPGAVRRD